MNKQNRELILAVKYYLDKRNTDRRITLLKLAEIANALDALVGSDER